MRRSRWLLFFLGVVVVGAGIVWMTGQGPDRLAVDGGVVTRQETFTSTVAASGEIVATRYADIGSNVMGTIVSLPVREGDAVEAGQVTREPPPCFRRSQLRPRNASLASRGCFLGFERPDLRGGASHVAFGLDGIDARERCTRTSRPDTRR